MCHDSPTHDCAHPNVSESQTLPAPVKYLRRGKCNPNLETSCSSSDESHIRAQREAVGREILQSEPARWNGVHPSYEMTWQLFDDVFNY